MPGSVPHKKCEVTLGAHAPPPNQGSPSPWHIAPIIHYQWWAHASQIVHQGVVRAPGPLNVAQYLQTRVCWERHSASIGKSNFVASLRARRLARHWRIYPFEITGIRHRPCAVFPGVSSSWQCDHSTSPSTSASALAHKQHGLAAEHPRASAGTRGVVTPPCALSAGCRGGCSLAPRYCQRLHRLQRLAGAFMQAGAVCDIQACTDPYACKQFVEDDRLGLQLRSRCQN